METTRALEIINLLASGVDPFTGEIFPEGSTLQPPDIVRALFVAKSSLQIMRKISKRPTAKDQNSPGQAGKAWTETEDHQLISEFDSGISTKDLASKHQRTVGAIRSRLIKLGKLDPAYKNG